LNPKQSHLINNLLEGAFLRSYNNRNKKIIKMSYDILLATIFKMLRTTVEEERKIKIY
jgi:hypothetical protein